MWLCGNNSMQHSGCVIAVYKEECEPAARAGGYYIAACNQEGDLAADAGGARETVVAGFARRRVVAVLQLGSVSRKLTAVVAFYLFEFRHMGRAWCC